MTSVVPADGSAGVLPGTATALSLKFNSPMTAALLPLIQLSPAVAGLWRFSGFGDSTMVRFLPGGPMSFATAYAIRVPAAVRDRLGNVMPTPFLSQFSTSEFRVIDIDPADGSGEIGTSSHISVDFSGPIDTANARAGFSLIPPAPGRIYFVTGYSNSLVFEPIPGVAARFVDAGHILGSAGLLLGINEKGRTLRFWFRLTNASSSPATLTFSSCTVTALSTPASSIGIQSGAASGRWCSI